MRNTGNMIIASVAIKDEMTEHGKLMWKAL